MNKFKKFLLATCLMVPCALTLTACGDKEGSSTGGGKLANGVCANQSCQYTKHFTQADFMEPAFYTWAAQKNFPKKQNMEYNAWVDMYFHDMIKTPRSYTLADNTTISYSAYHAAVCEACGNIKAEKHTFEHISNLSVIEHDIRCTDCGYTHTASCCFGEYGEIGKTERDCFCGNEEVKYDIFSDPMNLNGVQVYLDANCTGDIVIPISVGGKVVTGIKITDYTDFENREIKSLTIPYTAINRLDLSNNVKIEKIIITGYTEAQAYDFSLKHYELSQKLASGEISYSDYSLELEKLENATSPNSYNDCWIKLNGLTNLKSIEIAEGHYTLGGLNFAEIKNCTSLTSYTAEFINNSFENCPALTSISAGGVVFNDNDESTLPAGLSEVTFITLAENSVVALPSTVKTVNFKNVYSVPDYFFEGNSTIEVVNAPDVNEIGLRAFNQCENLKSVNFPDVTKIENSAFSYCNKLESATFSKVEKVGNHAFYGCSSLLTLNLATATEINYNAFDSCTSLKTVTLGDNLTNLEGDLFNNCYSLEEITIPKGVTEIGGGIFYDCRKLKTIRYNAVNANMREYAIELFRGACTDVEGGAELIIGKDVEKLPKNLTVASDGDSEYGAINITSITFETGSKLTKIESKAISNLKISSIVLPNSVTTVEDGAFYNNFFLTTINYGALDLSAAVLDNCPAYVYEVEAGLKYFGKTLVGVTSIVTTITPREGTTRAVALTDCDFIPESIKPYIESVVMPNSIIEWSASFEGLSNLESVTLSSGLTEISDNMFKNCGSLSSITIPNSITTIGENAFRYCQSLTSVNIPSSVKELKNLAFYLCINLTSVTLNEGLETIGGSAFGLCKALESITLPSTVRKIGRQAFDNAGFNNERFTVTLNEGLVELGEYALASSFITSVTLPSTLTTIKEGAFSASNLTSITLPNVITTIERETFAGCGKLSTISLPSNLKTIGENAFNYCLSLTTITIPASVENIIDYAFANCENLETITLEGNVTLSALATYNCTKYKGQLVDGLYYKGTTLSALNDTTAAFVYIKEGTTEIASGVFSNLTTLRGVYIPDSCKTIPTDTFAGCTNVTLLFESRWVTGLTGLNYGIGQVLQNSVVTRTGYLYETSGNDVVIKGYYGGEKNITIPTEMGGKTGNFIIGFNMYGKGAFEGNTIIESVTMGSNVIDIYGNGFKGCTSLTTVTMAEEMSMFNVGAFAGCTALTTVNITGSDFSIYAEDAYPGLDAPITTVSLTDPNFITYLTSTYTNYNWVRNLIFN